MSILITSPLSTNKGTFIVAPVSTVAGLVAPVAVSPLKPGSVSITSSSTKLGALPQIHYLYETEVLQFHFLL